MTNRRTFIKRAGVAALAVPMLRYTSWASSTESVLKIGIIGCGDRGSGIAEQLKGNKRFQITGVCDIIPFRLDNLAKSTGAKAFEDYSDLIEDKDVQAIIIASPFGLHSEMAIKAFESGKHIYCEKTMARGADQIQKMLDADKNSNVVFQVGHQYNTSDLYQKAEEIIEKGYLGEITAFECQWNRNGDWRREVPDPKWERIINWRMYLENSGGLVAELCSHQMDFICRVLGEVPLRAAGFGGIDHWKDGRETFDNVHILFEYPGGIDASFTCTTTNSFENYQIKVLGKKATLVLGQRDAKIYPEIDKKTYGNVDGVSGATITRWVPVEGKTIEADSTDITVQALEQFHASIFEKKAVKADIRSGAITSMCVQMALDAVHQKKVINWSDYPELKF